MPKALELTLDTMTAPPIPRAAQNAPTVPTEEAATPVKAKQGREAKPKKIEPKEPLQVRWPGQDVKAAKLAALQLDYPSVSEFMLACFHDYMKKAAGANK